MRYIRCAFLAALAVVLVTVAVANRAPVELRLLSDTLAGLIGVNATVTLPLFLVIFGGIVAGLLIGFVWEWFREHRIRAEARANRREKERLEREVSKLRKHDPSGTDDVLALLDDGGSSAQRAVDVPARTG